MLALLWFSLEREPMQLALLRQGDWWGIATMSIGLGALQTALEEGNKDDWLGSPFIVKLLVIAAIALPAFVWIELRGAHPLLNLRLLLRRNFGFGVVAMFLLGVALYGSVFVLPIYLAQVQGYNSEQIGTVLAWTGLPQLLLIPLVPRMMQRFDARYIVALGFGLFALSNFMNVEISTDIAADQLLLPNIVRAIGQALVLTPLTALASAGIEAENTGSASALLNVMRNLGGAIGIALLQTFLTKREQFHSNVLGQSVSMFDEATRNRLDNLVHYFLAHGVSDPALALHKAIVAVGARVHQQAYTMAFGDTFYLLGAALVVALVSALLLKKPGHLSAGGAH
jgi:DHA2 family multidrug resistance protein